MAIVAQHQERAGNLRAPDWDRHCAEHGAAAVLAASGRDLWSETGGCPRNWREAAAVYRRLGARDLAGAVTALLGPPINPNLAGRGDLAMVDGALGICRGDLVECLDRMQPIGRATKAWRSKACLNVGDDMSVLPPDGIGRIDRHAAGVLEVVNIDDPGDIAADTAAASG